MVFVLSGKNALLNLSEANNLISNGKGKRESHGVDFSRVSQDIDGASVVITKDYTVYILSVASKSQYTNSLSQPAIAAINNSNASAEDSNGLGTNL
ncbi:hypothetical protein JCM16418A_42820 [Paenibacillus pini]